MLAPWGHSFTRPSAQNGTRHIRRCRCRRCAWEEEGTCPARILPMVANLCKVAELNLAVAEPLQQVRICQRVAAHAIVLGAVPERLLAGGSARRAIARVFMAPVQRFKRVAEARAATWSLRVTCGGIRRVETAQTRIGTALIEGGHLQATRHCPKPSHTCLQRVVHHAAALEASSSLGLGDEITGGASSATTGPSDAL